MFTALPVHLQWPQFPYSLSTRWYLGSRTFSSSRHVFSAPMWEEIGVSRGTNVAIKRICKLHIDIKIMFLLWSSSSNCWATLLLIALQTNRIHFKHFLYKYSLFQCYKYMDPNLFVLILILVLCPLVYIASSHSSYRNRNILHFSILNCVSHYLSSVPQSPYFFMPSFYIICRFSNCA